MRSMTANFSLLAGCDGSARLVVGDTEVLVGVQGPRPPKALRLEDSTGALLEVTVSPPAGPASEFSFRSQQHCFLPERRTRHYYLRLFAFESLATAAAAEKELEGYLRDVFEPAIARSVMPRTVVTLVVQILHDAGSLWAAATNCCTLALADAGVPLVGLVSAAEALFTSAREGKGKALKAAAPMSIDHAATSSNLLLDPSEDELRNALAAPEQRVRLLHACLWRGDDAATLRLRSDGAASPEQLASLSETTRAAAATALAFIRLALTKRVERDALCFVGDAAAIGVATTTSTFKRPAVSAASGAGADAAAGADDAADADDAAAGNDD